MELELDAHVGEISRILSDLERDGVACLPHFVAGEQLAMMQRAFRARLRGLRWNNIDGYERTEPNRQMVEDVLTLEQGFVDAALHPVVKGVLRRYIGYFALVEAKGWRSRPTRRDFHGWHGDQWYEQRGREDIPREVKLGLYLTDVTSGAFNYIRGSHRKDHPKRIRTADLPPQATAQVVEVAYPAGTAFLFDTSGIHRQGVPMLDPREVVFFNYHDPRVPLQHEDVAFYRYHPLLLNAAFLGDLSDEDRQILGFGDKTNYIAAFEPPVRQEWLHRLFSRVHGANVWIRAYRERISTRAARLHSGARRVRVD